MPKASWISLGDFIANIPAAHRSGDGCKGLAPAAAYLIAQQSSDDCADADANRAILCNGGRLLVCRCWWLVRRCLRKLLAGPRLHLRVLDGMTMHYGFVLCAFTVNCRSRCDLMNNWLCGGRYRSGLMNDWLRGGKYRSGGERLCGQRRSLHSGRRPRRGIRSRQNTSHGCDAHETHENDGDCSAGHQGMDAVRGLIHFHLTLRVMRLIHGLCLYNARLSRKSDGEGIPDVTEFNKSKLRGLAWLYQVFRW